MRTRNRKTAAKQRGFTLMEVLVATMVMIVGLVAVAQLVPLSIRLNGANRDDSTALVYAQRELDEMLDQPINALSFTDGNGVLCAPVGAVCNLGDPTKPKVLVGSPVVMFNNTPTVDYTQAPVANYSFTYVDPNDPFRMTYDVRWAVITYSNGVTASGKRFIVGVQRRGGNNPLRPVTLDTMVGK